MESSDQPTSAFPARDSQNDGESGQEDEPGLSLYHGKQRKIQLLESIDYRLGKIFGQLAPMKDGVANISKNTPIRPVVPIQIPKPTPMPKPKPSPSPNHSSSSSSSSAGGHSAMSQGMGILEEVDSVIKLLELRKMQQIQPTPLPQVVPTPAFHMGGKGQGKGRGFGQEQFRGARY